MHWENSLLTTSNKLSHIIISHIKKFHMLLICYKMLTTNEMFTIKTTASKAYENQQFKIPMLDWFSTTSIIRFSTKETKVMLDSKTKGSSICIIVHGSSRIPIGYECQRRTS